MTNQTQGPATPTTSAPAPTPPQPAQSEPAPPPIQPAEVQTQVEPQITSAPEVNTPSATLPQEDNQPIQAPEPSTPSHMMTYDITTKDGLVYPNRVGPGDTNNRGDIDARIEMTPTNGRVTIQTFDRYLERLRDFREGKRELRQTRAHDKGHER